ncbi:hypothetical protein ACLA_054900 [Paecilomyces variotii No. 5]|uniref:Uncharacterized protein n=1 Tax=Byssochlamys spectabilis (strain No. 5 / NBRC 109023) TaxID=1356009 RepID=V5G3K6_BYSSN|nr:hypothetical protein ACLA_054900 [Paecilomyces variotii No. 5]
MMATLLATPPTLPRLDKALEIPDFHKSRALYNELLDGSNQPPVADEHIMNLAEMFTRHNAHKVLGIHLIHGHFKIPHCKVMLRTNFENPSLRWTKVTDIEKVDPSNIHRHIFGLTKDGLCAYELQDGPLPHLSDVEPLFLDEFINYISKNNLASLIGLQGTVMLDSSYVKNTVPTRITGWRFETAHGNPRVCTANETHAQMTSGNHKVFNAGKPLPKLESIEDLKAALAKAGVL